MLFDLFGDFADEGGRSGALRLGAVVSLAADLGVGESAVRSAVHRMVQDGWLATERQGRESVVTLTEQGRRLFAEGRRRIFAPAGVPWDGTWCVIAVSVPETRRGLRDRIRKEFSWLGLGSPSSGLYLSARDYRREVSELAEEFGARAYVQVYRAEAVWPQSPRDLVRRAWRNLTAINRRHRAFLLRFLPQLRSDRARLRRGALAGREAFRTRFELVNRFRKSLFSDPDLPPELQPEGWQGDAARRLFLEYHRLVSPLALAYFDAASQAAGRETGALVRAV